MKKLQRLSGLYNVTLTHLNSEFYGALISPRHQCLLEISCLSRSDSSKKIFQFTSSPTWGLSSVQVYQNPFKGSVYVLCISKQVGFLYSILVVELLSFSLLFGFLFPFSTVKSILCGSFSADTLTASNEEHC